MSIRLRDGGAEDIAQIVAMMRDFEEWLCGLDGSELSFDSQEVERRLHLHGFGARPRFRLLVAEGEASPQLLGYAIYDVSFWADGLMPVILMSDFYVAPDMRRQGLGRMLLTRLSEIGQEEGCESILWTVWRPNLEAQAFYEALGAEAIDDERMMMLKIDAGR